MRSEHEMMELIIRTAQADDRILAAYLKGSRTNPNVPKDSYRDFDVMYVVTETCSFIKDTHWMNNFGKVVLMQEQDTAFGYGERFGLQQNYNESYSWLLLLEDGNRIDIGVELLSVMESGRNRNKLFLPLLDKTGCLPQLPPPTDQEFHIKSLLKNNFWDAAMNFTGVCVMWQKGLPEMNCPLP